MAPRCVGLTRWCRGEGADLIHPQSPQLMAKGRRFNPPFDKDGRWVRKTGSCLNFLKPRGCSQGHRPESTPRRCH